MPALKPLLRVVAAVGLFFLLLSFIYRFEYDGLMPYERAAKPFWLIATMSMAKEQRRRNMIRTTWHTLYKDYGIKTIFVLNNPTNVYWPLIEHENATYGDIIVHEHLVEEPGPNKTIKSVELYKRLIREGQQFKFVSKTDDDSWIDVPNFIQTFLIPLWDAERTFIARQLVNSDVNDQSLWETGYRWPGGQFYTLTWDLVELVAKLHDANFITDDHEDRIHARLLYEAGEGYDIVRLENQEAFDWGPAKGTEEDVVAGENDDLTKWVHPVGPGAINPHKLKKDSVYMKVAALYDEYGQKTPIDVGKLSGH
ncbi:hypothetical protein NA57DRAFT_58231 [Rhizodiscina lignyota]|uniref:Hexosyltransferase n=1 Tax=Rhizodiscina lignyota TaxID=1504668 RepID=A0A9P4M7Z8_9PEZI|nr:hypothetical protein NA57DRAFT_58231 [Rhizodiscina lignyota]